MTPQLRFPEFTDEWQMKKLGDIFEFKRTNSLSRAQLSEDGKVGNIHYGDIHKSLPTLLDASKVKLPMIVSSKQFNTADAIKVGDVILADAFEDYADIGKVIEVVNLNHGQELYSGLHTFLMRPAYPSAHGFNGMLFKTATIRKQLMRIATGISVLGVSKNNVSQLVVATPSKPEQEKIADFLTAVDEWIGVGEEKLELLETYKRGVMQKIFSQQVRFKDANGNPYPDWEEKKLSDVLKERNTQMPISGEYPLMAFVAYEGVAPKGDRYNREFLVSDAKSKKYKQTQLGDFIYSSNNLETGSIGLNLYGSASISPVYSIFETRDGYSHQFLGAYLTRKKFIYQMVRYRQGVVYGQWRIHESEFLKIEEKFPCTGEQQKIADFLTTLDEKITAEKSKLTAAREFKKALLQRMFA